MLNSFQHRSRLILNQVQDDRSGNNQIFSINAGGEGAFLEDGPEVVETPDFLRNNKKEHLVKEYI